MEEREALQRLKKQEEQALVWFIRQYSGYVNTVICNVLGPAPAADPVEDLISDVFLTLWQKAQDLQGERVKSWLAVVARNRAKKYLQSRGRELPLEEDLVLVAPDDVEQEAWLRERDRRVNEALLSLGHPDREIFYRYYYYCQPVKDIAQLLEMKEATVKTRLHRGRKALKKRLTEGGFMDEVSDL